jgi:hypothetical protein
VDLGAGRDCTRAGIVNRKCLESNDMRNTEAKNAMEMARKWCRNGGGRGRPWSQSDTDGMGWARRAEGRPGARRRWRLESAAVLPPPQKRGLSEHRVLSNGVQNSTDTHCVNSFWEHSARAR